MEGWILLHRKSCDHPFYKERKIFSRWEAWVDLLFLANHNDHKFLLGSEMVEAKRAEVITSELTLMERWRWSKSKVRRYIKNLEDERMVIKKADSKKTTIFIINYDSYQKPQTAKEPQKDRRKTAERPQTIHNQIRKKNEIKNYKEKKEDTPLLPGGGETTRTPGYSNDGSVCFITEDPEDCQYLSQTWNYFLADVGKAANEEKVGLAPVEITPERKAVIFEGQKEWPDLFMRWIPVVAHILHCPFLLGENREGWKIDFDSAIKPGIAKFIYENKSNLNELKVLKSLMAMAREIQPGLRLGGGQDSPRGNEGDNQPQGLEDQAPEPQGDVEELFDRNQSPDETEDDGLF